MYTCVCDPKQQYQIIKTKSFLFLIIAEKFDPSNL